MVPLDTETLPKDVDFNFTWNFHHLAHTNIQILLGQNILVLSMCQEIVPCADAQWGRIMYTVIYTGSQYLWSRQRRNGMGVIQKIRIPHFMTKVKSIVTELLKYILRRRGKHCRDKACVIYMCQGRRKWLYEVLGKNLPGMAAMLTKVSREHQGLSQG